MKVSLPKLDSASVGSDWAIYSNFRREHAMKMNSSRLPFLPLLLATVFCCLAAQPVAAQRSDDAFRKGRDLNAQEAAELEEKLAAKPDDTESRKILIENDPESGVFQSTYVDIKSASNLSKYRKAANKWEELLKKSPDNVEILMSAAKWFSHSERDTAIELALREKGTREKVPGRIRKRFRINRAKEAITPAGKDGKGRDDSRRTGRSRRTRQRDAR